MSSLTPISRPRAHPAVGGSHQGALPSCGYSPELVMDGGVYLGNGHRFHRRHVHVLALARKVAGVQGQHRAGERGHTHRVGHHAAAYLQRLAVRQADRVHQRAHSLRHDVAALVIAVWACLAKWRDGDVHQAGVVRCQRLVAQAERRHPARRAALDEHVAALGQAAQDVRPALALQVQRYALLAGVEVQIGRAALRVRLVAEEWAFASGRLAVAGALDLDDLGPHAGQQLGAIRPRHAFAEVQGRDAAEQVLARLHAIRRLPVAAPIVRCRRVGASLRTRARPPCGPPCGG